MTAQIIEGTEVTRPSVEPITSTILDHFPLALVGLGDDFDNGLHILRSPGLGGTEQHIVHAVGEGRHRRLGKRTGTEK